MLRVKEVNVLIVHSVNCVTQHFFFQVGYLTPEKSIPDAILKQAKGLAILTVAKVGVMVTYNIGTGLVVARRQDGSWSPPSAVSTFGIGWGAQVKYTIFLIIEGDMSFSSRALMSYSILTT